MGNTKNIYITYSETVVKEDNKLSDWIDTFIENLQISISRFFNSNPGYIIKEKDFSQSDYTGYIKKSEVFIIIINDKYETDELFLQELNDICNHLNITKSYLNLEGLSKVLKVYTNLVEKNNEPESLQQVIPYNFYKVNLFNRKTTTFEFNNEDDALVAWSKLLDITYFLKEILTPKESRQESKKFVFLSETSLDQTTNRDEISRELQHFGFRILPLTILPNDLDEIKKDIEKCLDISLLIVQIFGAQYGNLVGNGRFSLPDYQNQVIEEFINQRTKDIRRIIWIPSGIRITDQRQNILLNKIRRDEKINTEIIESPIEVFKSALQERITNEENEDLGEGQNPGLYLIYENEDRDSIQPIKNYIEKEGFNFLSLEQSSQENIYSNHLKYLKNADYILIYEGSKNLFWLKSKIRDLIKAPGIGRTKALDKISILSDRLIDSKDFDFIANRLNFIKTDESSITDYLKKLRNSHDNQ